MCMEVGQHAVISSTRLKSLDPRIDNVHCNSQQELIMTFIFWCRMPWPSGSVHQSDCEHGAWARYFTIIAPLHSGVIIIINICSVHIHVHVSTLLGAQGTETKKKHEYKQFIVITKTKLCTEIHVQCNYKYTSSLKNCDIRWVLSTDLNLVILHVHVWQDLSSVGRWFQSLMSRDRKRPTCITPGPFWSWFL